MPSRRYALEHGQPKRLTIHYDREGQDLRVVFDSCDVPPDVAGGNDFRLPGGSFLTVHWVSTSGGHFDVEPVVNARVLPGSSLDPRTQIHVAAITCAVVALLHVAIGFVPLGSLVSLPAGRTPSPAVLYTGAAIVGALSAGIHFRLQVAVALALLVIAAEAVVLTNWVLGLTFTFRWILFFAPLPLIAQAFTGIQALKEEAESSSTVSPQ